MASPNDIKLDNGAVDVTCHPERNVVASGLIDGQVLLHSYSSTEGNHSLLTLSHHKKSCRCLRFSLDGDSLYTAAKDKSLQAIDLNTAQVVRKISKAHECPVYSMLVLGEHFLATGDDDGRLKIWDSRVNTAVMDMKESDEFISDMALDDDRKVLAVTSGEGTVTAFNIRRRRMDLQSELFDSEFLSVVKAKGGSKLVCGDGEGVLNFFNWGEWGNISDRFPCHPTSIDCMVSVSKNIICTGSMDGKIRAVNLLPNRILGVVGQHEKYPVENLTLSHDQKLLVSCSHDQTIKFWDISELGKEKVKAHRKIKHKEKHKVLKSAKKEGFFSDLADEGDKDAKNDSDDDDDASDDDNDNDSGAAANNDHNEDENDNT